MSAGKEAMIISIEISSIRKKYQLPTTGIIVELNEPTAHDFVNVKLPLIRELYHRYRPDDVELKVWLKPMTQLWLSSSI